jgi:threonine dehydratase
MQLIYPRNVTELSYRWSDPKWADIVVSLQTLKGQNVEQDKEHVLTTLITRGYLVHDFSGNELAKAHIRHLAGGRPGRDLYAARSSGLSSSNKSGQSKAVGNGERTEAVYRFEFPEHPGALGKFLFALTDFNRDWNISLFHYRNHGHDIGRVLVGILVLQEEVVDLQAFLKKLGYVHYEETNNVAFTHFLK